MISWSFVHWSFVPFPASPSAPTAHSKEPLGENMAMDTALEKPPLKADESIWAIGKNRYFHFTGWKVFMLNSKMPIVGFTDLKVFMLNSKMSIVGFTDLKVFMLNSKTSIA